MLMDNNYASYANKPALPNQDLNRGMLSHRVNAHVNDTEGDVFTYEGLNICQAGLVKLVISQQDQNRLTLNDAFKLTSA